MPYGKPSGTAVPLASDFRPKLPNTRRGKHAPAGVVRCGYT